MFGRFLLCYNKEFVDITPKYAKIENVRIFADVAELADALDLGSSGHTRAGSSPVIRSGKVTIY